MTLKERLNDPMYSIKDQATIIAYLFFKPDDENKKWDGETYKVSFLVEKVDYGTLYCKANEVARKFQDYIESKAIQQKIENKRFIDPVEWDNIMNSTINEYGRDYSITFTVIKTMFIYGKGGNNKDAIEYYAVVESKYMQYTATHANFLHSVNRADYDIMKYAYGTSMNPTSIYNMVNHVFKYFIPYMKMRAVRYIPPTWDFKDLDYDLDMLAFYWDKSKVKSNKYLVKFYPSYKNLDGNIVNRLSNSDCKFRVQLALCDSTDDPRNPGSIHTDTYSSMIKGRTYDFKNVANNLSNIIYRRHIGRTPRDNEVFGKNNSIRWYNPCAPYILEFTEYDNAFMLIKTNCDAGDYYYGVELRYNGTMLMDTDYLKYAIEQSMKIGIGYTKRNQIFGIDALAYAD